MQDVLPTMVLLKLSERTSSVDLLEFALTHSPVEPPLSTLLTTLDAEPTSWTMPTTTATKMDHASPAQPMPSAMPTMEEVSHNNLVATKSLESALVACLMLTALKSLLTVEAMDSVMIAVSTETSVELDLMALLQQHALTLTAILKLESVSTSVPKMLIALMPVYLVANLTVDVALNATLIETAQLTNGEEQKKQPRLTATP